MLRGFYIIVDYSASINLFAEAGLHSRSAWSNSSEEDWSLRAAFSPGVRVPLCF